MTWNGHSATPRQSKRWTAVLALSLAGVVTADQASKALAHGHPIDNVVSPSVNPDLSLGIASGDPGVLTVAMAVGLAVALIIGLLEIARRPAAAWAVGVVLGGAASNLLDRLILGAVRDFLVTGPIVWNLADTAVVVGITGWVVGSRRVFSGSRATPGELASTLRCRPIERRWHP